MTRKEFLALELKDISQVYEGALKCCRCGCSGDYTATSFMENPRSNVDDELVLNFLEEAKELMEDECDFDFFGNGINIIIEEDDYGLTFYFDELKK